MTKTYVRRTPEQMIADLEEKIAKVKARAAAKSAKAEPAGKALLAAAKSVDKAIETAHGNADLVRALESARAQMSEQMIRMGLRVPDRKARTVRRRKETDAA